MVGPEDSSKWKSANLHSCGEFYALQFRHKIRPNWTLDAPFPAILLPRIEAVLGLRKYVRWLTQNPSIFGNFG
jgi:hypothetical protein